MKYIKNKGFTLIELLIVIGIVSILAVAVVAVINPGLQFASARDAARESHINTLYNGLISYQISNYGTFSGLDLPQGQENLTEICNTNLEDPDCTELIDLSIIVDENYISQIPVDPQGGVDPDGTGYFLAEGSIILVAEKAETRFLATGVSEEEYSGVFSCGNSFTDDRDGQTYGTIQIGEQCWMAENINYDDEVEGENWCPADYEDNEYCDTHGRLYNWFGALWACPEGWSLPSDYDFQELIDGQGANAGDKLKKAEACSSLGESYCGESGWNGKMSGEATDDGLRLFFGDLGIFWTDTSVGGGDLVAWEFHITSSEPQTFNLAFERGHSVRCILDDE